MNDDVLVDESEPACGCVTHGRCLPRVDESLLERVEALMYASPIPGVPSAYVAAFLRRRRPELLALARRRGAATQPAAASRIAEGDGPDPLDRWRAQGISCLSDGELLTLLLDTRNRKRRQAQLNATGLLERFGDLKALLNASAMELVNVDGLDESAVVRLEVVGELARRLTTISRKERAQFRNGRDVFEAYHTRMADLPQEEFVAVLLDARNRRIRDVTVARGSLTEAVVHPREVFAPAIRERAAQLIVLHNHPSGDPEPSTADIELTRRLVETGRVIGIAMLDHVIIGRGRYVSLEERGLIISGARR